MGGFRFEASIVLILLPAFSDLESSPRKSARLAVMSDLVALEHFCLTNLLLAIFAILRPLHSRAASS